VTSLTGKSGRVRYRQIVTLFENKFRVETTRLPGWDYRSPGWYFVTICTKDKRSSLGNIADGDVMLSPAGMVAEEEMKKLSNHYSNVSVDRFVVMPNHVHAIIVIDGQHRYSPNPAVYQNSAPLAQGPLPGSLSAIVRGYKAGVSRICRNQGIRGFEWQTRFHDRILPSNAAVNMVRDYIDKNPENWRDDPDHVL
jgi:putative transposase